jgi:hypothetical protein
VGLVLVGCAPAGLALASALPSPVSASTEASVEAPRVLTGGVDVDGATPSTASGLHFERRSEGVYRFEAVGTRLEGFDVTRWDAVAEVTIVPLAGGDREIRFVDAAGPVDTAFSYRVSFEG